MRLFSSSTSTSNTEQKGPAVQLKQSKWRKLFQNRKRTSSLSSAISAAYAESFNDRSSISSTEDIRVIGHVEEIILRNDRPESAITSSATTTYSSDSVDLPPLLKKELFSDNTIFVNPLEDQDGEIQRLDTFNSVYMDALEEERELEVKDTMEIAVVAEIQDGTSRV